MPFLYVVNTNCVISTLLNKIYYYFNNNKNNKIKKCIKLVLIMTSFLKIKASYHSVIENNVYYNLLYLFCIGHISIILSRTSK